MVLKVTHNSVASSGYGLSFLELLAAIRSGCRDYRCFPLKKPVQTKRQVRQVGTIQRPSIKLPKEEGL